MKKVKVLVPIILFVTVYVLYNVIIRQSSCDFNILIMDCNLKVNYMKCFYLSFLFIILLYFLSKMFYKKYSLYYSWFCIIITILDSILLYNYVSSSLNNVSFPPFNNKIMLFIIIIEPLLLWVIYNFDILKKVIKKRT